MNQDISIKAGFELSSHQLRVTYTVINNGDRTAYLINRLFDTKPDLKIRADRVFVDLGPDSTIHLSKRVPDIPKGCTVLSPYAPYDTPVQRGARFEEDFTLTLPIEIWWPSGYELVPRRQQPVLRLFQGIDLQIDLYWAVDGVREDRATIGGDHVVLPVFPPGKRPTFGSLKSDVFCESIPVLDPRP